MSLSDLRRIIPPTGGGGGGGEDPTPSEILAALQTIDGPGSGLDADTVDGQHAAAFVLAANLTESIQDVVATTVSAGTNIAVSYDDTAGLLTFSVTGLTSSAVGDFTEAVQDVVGALGFGGSGLTSTYNDAAGTLTVAVNVDDSSIEVSGDALRVKAGGVTDAMLAGGIANSKLATDPLARANHTGTQTASTISDFTEAAQDVMGAALTAGTGATVTYNDAAGTLTVAVSGLTSASLSDFTEAVQDVVGALGFGGNGLTATYNDASNTLTVSVNVDDSSIEINSDTLRVKAAGVTDAMLAGSISNSKLATNPLARANHTGTQLAATISDLTSSVQTVGDARYPRLSTITAANQVLTGSASGTMAPLDVPASRIVGREASGNVKALTVEEVTGLLGLSENVVSFNVTDYGALGDGSTDDTTAIQDAINAAVAAAGLGARVVFFPAGTYIVSNWLVYDSRLVLVGAGRDSTTIKNTTTRVSSTLMLRPNGTDVHDVTVAGITWDQRGDVYDASADSTSEPLLDCSNTINMAVVDCGFRNVRTVGVYGDGTATHPMVNLVVARNHVYQAGGDGISFFGSLIDSLIDGNIVEHTQDDAIAVQDHVSTSEYPTRVRIVNNTVLDCDSQTTYGSTPNGIYVFGGDGCLVANNYIKNVYGSCIKVGIGSGRRATNVTVRDNRVGGAGTNNAPGSGTPAHGIMLNGVDNITIANTVIVSANKDYNFSFLDYTANTGIRVVDDGGLQTVTYASSITPNPLNGENIAVTLTGNITFVAPAVAVAKPGGRMALQVTQDATGGRTVALSGIWKGAWAPSTTASSTSTSEWRFDGTNWVLQSSSVTSTEEVQDIVGAMLTAGANITVTYNDAAGTATVAATGLAATSGATFTGNVNLSAVNVVTDTTTGTKFGTAGSQKIAFYGATPIVQPGSTQDLRTALISLGLLATGGATPLNLNGGALTAGTLTPAGLTGATQTVRLVGGTTTGAPSTGTFAVGDLVVARDGVVWICTTAGSPGTWTQSTTAGAVLLTGNQTVAGEKTFANPTAVSTSSTDTTPFNRAIDLALQNTSATNNNYMTFGFYAADGTIAGGTLYQVLNHTSHTGRIGFATRTAGGFATRLTVDDSVKVTAGTPFLAPLVQNAQTGTTYTVVLADAGKLVELNNAASITCTVPTNATAAFDIGTQINLLQTGAGQVTVAAAGGVTLNGAPGLKLTGQWSAATLIKRATNTWVLIGDLSS